MKYNTIIIFLSLLVCQIVSYGQKQKINTSLLLHKAIDTAFILHEVVVTGSRTERPVTQSLAASTLSLLYCSATVLHKALTTS